MEQKHNIFGTKDCFGCGLCSMACRSDVISIELNKDGFYEPSIVKPEGCTLCGLCLDVCSYHHDGLANNNKNINSYAAWSNDLEIRKKCSSGGVGFEVARACIEQGYYVVGVRFNAEKNRAEHYIAETIEELTNSIGSKYIQSFTEEAFLKIDKKQKHLIIGTPCQIDSFRRYVKKFRCEENFIFLDFFCHGVPSKLMWNKYVLSVEKKTGKLKSARWRDKTYGWHDSWRMVMIGQDRTFSKRWREKDIFYELFLGNVCLGSQCYDACKFKYDKSSADIRIGDLWGKLYSEDVDGVSTAITFTEKGYSLLKNANCTIVEHPLSIVVEGQIHKPVDRSEQFGLVKKLLQDKSTTIEEIYNMYLRDIQRRKIIKFLTHPQLLIKKIRIR